ncbi:HAD-IA family hydrolase [Corynebacterium kalidii]|uniref:HAD-IA family hydrolase n=1 Tax=Corynebacterium kalidii TaxID=2931982 RepID=A0A9X1WGR9_9CORY|nr:HAD-IA family hydrolase [Corynebacterium kalidii]MCJ7858153.1 HAD-IA family hydrolase [Corynebacterium kalidii]
MSTEPTSSTFTVAAILFDIDGTLVDSTPAVNRAWRSWAARHGIDADAVLAVCHGRRSADTIAEFLPAEDVAAEAEELERVEAADVDGVVALPGAAELLAALPESAWAAVTSGSRALMRARLAAAGLPVPEVLVAAEDVTEGKPDPQGYRAAARRLGVDPADCLVLEDAPAGLGAGRAAGGRVLAVATSHPRAQLEALDGEMAADAVLDGLTDLTVEVRGDRLAVTVAGVPLES